MALAPCNAGPCPLPQATDSFIAMQADTKLAKKTVKTRILQMADFQSGANGGPKFWNIRTELLAEHGGVWAPRPSSPSRLPDPPFSVIPPSGPPTWLLSARYILFFLPALSMPGPSPLLWHLRAFQPSCTFLLQ